jgi:hypothetical protein
MNNVNDGLKLMDASDLKRVRIDTTGGLTCYCTGAWPGWQNLRLMFLLIGILAFVEAVMLFMHFQFSKAFGGDDWFSWIVNFAVPWPIVFEIIITVMLLLSPLFVMSLLSSKRVWVDTGSLHAEKKFLFWKRHKKISLVDIIDITLGKDGSEEQYFYKIFVSYRLNLPPWLEYVLPKKADHWITLLLDAIPSKTEADFVLEKILGEVITAK